MQHPRHIHITNDATGLCETSPGNTRVIPTFGTVKIMNRRVASISVLLAFWCCSAPDIAEPITLNTICATQIPGLLAKCVESEQVKKWIEDHHMVHCELWSNIYDTLFVYLNEIARAPSFSGWRKLTMYP